MIIFVLRIRASKSSVKIVKIRREGGLTKKTEVNRRTAAMITAKRKSHASPDLMIDRLMVMQKRERERKRKRWTEPGVSAHIDQQCLVRECSP